MKNVTLISFNANITFIKGQKWRGKPLNARRIAKMLDLGYGTEYNKTEECSEA